MAALTVWHAERRWIVAQIARNSGQVFPVLKCYDLRPHLGKLNRNKGGSNG